MRSWSIVNKSLSESLSSAIRKLDLNNRPVCVHASLRAFNPRVMATELLEVFLDAGCTILVPTFTYFFEVSPPSNDHLPVNGMLYTGPESVEAQHRQGVDGDPGSKKRFRMTGADLSLSEMGGFSAAVLARSDRVRGDHPLNSFTAVGPLAKELITGQNWEDVYSPLERLTARNGRILLMGTDLTSLTFIHYAEQHSGRRLFVRWSSNSKNQPCRVRVGSCSRAFNNLEPSITCSETTIHGAQWRAFSAKAALKQLSRTIAHRPEITQCDDANCLRCNDALAGGPVTT